MDGWIVLTRVFWVPCVRRAARSGLRKREGVKNEVDQLVAQGGSGRELGVRVW